MEKNLQLLFCILGGLFLSLLNTPMFNNAKLALWLDKGYGSNIFGVITHYTTNIISFIGFILVIIFSVLLIINNSKLLFKNYKK